MLFFDEDNPNKYSALKKELVPQKIIGKNGLIYEKRKYGKGDGGYVLGNSGNGFRGESIFLLSYGIGSDPLGVSFERSFGDPELGIEKIVIKMYDGSIEKMPAEVKFASLFREHLTKDNFKNHLSELRGLYKPTISILKMDVEGCEYDFLTDENLKILADTFDQFTLEVHGLIEETPDGWIIEDAIQDAKNNLQKKVDFFKKLNQHFYLFHIHGNNHAPRYVDFPDSLELTYVNKRICDSIGISQQRCPDLSVDEPNFDGRPEFILDWWI